MENIICVCKYALTESRFINKIMYGECGNFFQQPFLDTYSKHGNYFFY